MSLLGTIHVGLAVAAMAAGLAVALAPKGTRTHRRLGWTYLVAMLGLNATALMIYRLFGGFGPFHLAALMSLAALAGGMVPARRRRPRGAWIRIHAYFMAWSYVGLLAAAAAEVLSRVPASPFWGMVGVATGIVFLAGNVVVNRYVPPALARFRQ